MDKETPKAIKELLLKPMIPVERPAPKGDTCTECDSDEITVTSALAWGPWSGRVKCKKCGHEETVMSHLGKKIVVVEPMRL